MRLAGLLIGLAALPARAATDGAAVVELWSRPPISSDQFESHPAFDPLSGDLYFVRSDRHFRGWRILRSRCGDAGWSEPEPPVFAGDGVEADPWFTSDGKSLYFISSRSTDGRKREDMDIWRVDRASDGSWGEPYRLPEPVNSSHDEWFPRLGADGWLYFGSDRPGGFGKTDIWRARQDEAGAWIVENAGAGLNSEGDEYEAAPSPDGKRLILMTDSGFFLSERSGEGWSPRRPLPAEIDSHHHEIGALWSPSGRSLMFSRSLGGELSGELFLWRLEPEDWPPACPRSAAHPHFE